MSRIAPALLALGVFAVYLRCLAPGISLSDGGELAAAALTLGITHPPGYPLYALAGKLASLLPVGSPAFRIGLLSALSSLVAVLTAWRLLADLGGRTGWGGIAGLGGAVAFAFSRTAWWQAGMAEKYPLAGALFALAFLALCKALSGGHLRWILGASLLTGLSLSHHLMGVYLLLPLFWVLLRFAGRRVLFMSLLCLFVPLSLKPIYIPIRAAAVPELNWAEPTNIGRFADYSLAGPYMRKFAHVGPAGEMAGLLWRQVVIQPWLEFGPLLLILPFGFWALWRFSRPLAWLAILTGGANFVCGAIYRTPEVERLFLPAWWLSAVAIGAGAGLLASRRRGFAIPVAALILFQVSRSAPLAFQGRDYLAPDHLRNMLVTLKPGSLLIAAGDPWLLPLLYVSATGDVPADFRLAPGRSLILGRPERRQLERLIPGCAGCLDVFQEGPALLWEVRDRVGPESVYLTQGALVGQIPSQGANWRGVLFRAKSRDAPFGLDPISERPIKWMRFRGLMHPKGLFGRILTRYYSAAFLAHGEIMLKAGRPANSLGLARLGLRILTAEVEGMGELSAQLHVLAGKAKVQMGAATADMAEEHFLRSLKFSGGRSLEALVGLADLELRRGRREPALAHMARAAEMAAGPDHPAVPSALESISKGRISRALQECHRAVSAGFASAGQTLLVRGDLYGASTALRRALELDGGNHEAMLGLGMLAFVEERFGDARKRYRQAMSAGSKRSELAAEEERARTALDWLGKLPELQARLAAKRSAENLCEVGNACWYIGRIRAAGRFYRRALAADPNYARAWGNLGSVLVHQGDIEGGLKSYHRALESDPGYIEAMTNLASVHRQLGNGEESRKWIAKAAQARPDSPEVKRMLEELAAVEEGFNP